MCCMSANIGVCVHVVERSKFVPTIHGESIAVGGMVCHSHHNVPHPSQVTFKVWSHRRPWRTSLGRGPSFFQGPLGLAPELTWRTGLVKQGSGGKGWGGEGS